MNELDLVELCRQSLDVSKTDHCLLKWQNSGLSVTMSKFVQFFDFTYNLQCLDKNIDWVHKSISCSEHSPANFLFGMRNSNREYENTDLTQMIVNPAYWSHNPELAQNMVTVCNCVLSPIGFMLINDFVVAILNNIGSVEIYAKESGYWKSVLNLSNEIEKIFSNDLIADVKNDNSIQNLKKAVNIVETCAICWAPDLNTDRSCYFVTCQNNGSIIFWLLKSEKDIKVNLLSSLAGYGCEIVSVIWIPKSDSEFVLLYSNILGQIRLIHCKVDGKNIINTDTNLLWEHKDRIICNHILYAKIKDKIFIICNKYRYITVLMLDNKFKLLSQFTKNLNDHKIVSIVTNCDKFYITTTNCKIYKMEINIEDNSDVKYNIMPVELKMNVTSPLYEAVGFVVSENNMIFALALIDRKVSIRKGQLEIEIVFFSNNDINSLFTSLLDNPTKSLSNLWDHVELLRCKIMKERLLPSIDFDQLSIEAENDLYKLRLYFMILKLNKILEDAAKLFKGKLSEVSFDNIKENILALHARSTINDLYITYCKTKNLNRFQSEVFVGLRTFLRNYYSKCKKDASEFKEIFKINIPDVIYTCQSCDKKLQGLSCIDGHINVLCSVTLTLIDVDDYLECKCCGALARIELLEHEPKCTFCDIYLNIARYQNKDHK